MAKSHDKTQATIEQARTLALPETSSSGRKQVAIKFLLPCEQNKEPSCRAACACRCACQLHNDALTGVLALDWPSRMFRKMRTRAEDGPRGQSQLRRSKMLAGIRHNPFEFEAYQIALHRTLAFPEVSCPCREHTPCQVVSMFVKGYHQAIHSKCSAEHLAPVSFIMTGQ